MKNFDRVADVYDATREMPAAVVTRVADAMLTVTGATADTTFLEIGVGTGRIALPLVERTHHYTGVDVSKRMMDVLRAKVKGREGRLTLLNADITQLPLPDASFDVVLGVHILHLIPDWRAAIREARRVMKPEGYFLLGYETGQPDDPANVIRAQWHEYVQNAGVDLRTRAGHQGAVAVELHEQGAYASVYRAGYWVEELRPADLLEQQVRRVFSHSWEVPEDVLQAVHTRMVAWATERYGSLDLPLRSEREFLLTVYRFPEGAPA